MCLGEKYGSFLAKASDPVPATVSLELILVGVEAALLIIRLGSESKLCIANPRCLRLLCLNLLNQSFISLCDIRLTICDSVDGTFPCGDTLMCVNVYV